MMGLNFTNQERYVSKYKRFLIENEENRIKALYGMLLFTIVVFAIFGIRPLLKKTREYHEIYQALYEVNNQLIVKSAAIDENSQKIDRFEYKVGLLNKKIPSSPIVQDYLEEVVTATGNTGFILQRLLAADPVDDSINIELQLTGNSAQLSELVSYLENTNRFAVINEIKTSKDKEETIVRINLTIYFNSK